MDGVEMKIEKLVRCMSFVAMLGSAGIRCLPQANRSGEMRPAVAVAPILEFLHKTAGDPDQLSDPLLGRPRILVNRTLGIVQFRPGPVAAAEVLSPQEHLGVPLEELIRLQVYRRDVRTAFPEDRSWEPIFEAINATVNDCVSTYAETEVMDCAAAEAKFELIRQHVEERARKTKLTVVTIRGRWADTYLVKFVFTPKRVRFRTMTELEYRKRLFFKEPLDVAWVDVLADKENLVGRYHYQVDWPTDLGGPKEGDFEIKEPGTLTIKSQ